MKTFPFLCRRFFYVWPNAATATDRISQSTFHMLSSYTWCVQEFVGHNGAAWDADKRFIDFSILFFLKQKKWKSLIKWRTRSKGTNENKTKHYYHHLCWEPRTPKKRNSNTNEKKKKKPKLHNISSTSDYSSWSIFHSVSSTLEGIVSGLVAHKRFLGHLERIAFAPMHTRCSLCSCFRWT